MACFCSQKHVGCSRQTRGGQRRGRKVTCLELAEARGMMTPATASQGSALGLLPVARAGSKQACRSSNERVPPPSEAWACVIRKSNGIGRGRVPIVSEPRPTCRAADPQTPSAREQRPHSVASSLPSPAGAIVSSPGRPKGALGKQAYRLRAPAGAIVAFDTGRGRMPFVSGPAINTRCNRSADTLDQRAASPFCCFFLPEPRRGDRQ